MKMAVGEQMNLLIDKQDIEFLKKLVNNKEYTLVRLKEMKPSQGTYRIHKEQKLI